MGLWSPCCRAEVRPSSSSELQTKALEEEREKQELEFEFGRLPKMLKTYCVISLIASSGQKWLWTTSKLLTQGRNEMMTYLSSNVSRFSARAVCDNGNSRIWCRDEPSDVFTRLAIALQKLQSRWFTGRVCLMEWLDVEPGTKERRIEGKKRRNHRFMRTFFQKLLIIKHRTQNATQKSSDSDNIWTIWKDYAQRVTTNVVDDDGFLILLSLDSLSFSPNTTQNIELCGRIPALKEKKH